ncbi:MAG: SAM-dependent chlorinase/fluorinase [bacterium]|nr:SAM-dependent chlorinase/fluorinase [bacterium]MCP4965429.1 SAM-dependent chlorinase/fluorinase [bacterium]
MTFITLTTDFGTRQGSHTVLHGAIYGIAPDAVITDLSHEITPQDIREANFVVNNSAFFFPDGTVHVIVVDPGVGTERRAIAARIGSHYFVAPDNGVLSACLRRADEMGWSTEFVDLDKPEYWLTNVTNTFHGRDLFAPVGAHLGAGVSLGDLGSAMTDPILMPLWEATQHDDGSVSGEVIYIDDFGNAICSILPDEIAHLPVPNGVKVELGGATIDGMVRTFGDSEYGTDTLIALWDSSGYLLVSENNGTGGKVIQPCPGDRVTVRSQ